MLAQRGAVLGTLGEELALHAPLVLEEEFLTAIFVEINASILRLKVFGIENLVAEEVEGQGFDKNWPEWFDEVQGEGPSAIFGGVEKSQRGIQAVRMNESDGFAV